MNRIINNIGRKVIVPTVTARPAIIAKLPTVNIIRSFAGHAGSGDKAEPFLDPKQVTERIIEVVKNFEKVKADKVTATARFKEDLDLDSLDAVEVVMAIEEEFSIEIPDSEADKIYSIQDAVAYVSNHPMAKA